MFANEKKCESWEEVIQEAEAMQATGTGITGGDPMLDFEKTVEAIQQLKNPLDNNITFIATLLFQLMRKNAGLLQRRVWMKLDFIYSILRRHNIKTQLFIVPMKALSLESSCRLNQIRLRS